MKAIEQLWNTDPIPETDIQNHAANAVDSLDFPAACSAVAVSVGLWYTKYTDNCGRNNFRVEKARLQSVYFSCSG